MALTENTKFGYEDLEVWKKSVSFAEETINVVENISTDRKHYRLLEQIEASAASVSLNIAEGKGRFSKKEFIQFLYISRGSLYETMALLEIFRRKTWVSQGDYEGLKQQGLQIASMIKGLIKSIHKDY
jgi:four helix bundle protein